MPRATLRIRSNDPASPKDLPLRSLMGNAEQVVACPEDSITTDGVIVPAGAYTGETLAEADAAAIAGAALSCQWANAEQTTPACGAGSITAPVTVAAGEVISNVSQADADATALAQALATRGPCRWVNTEQTANCPAGYTGDPVTVAAGTYTSNVSQADADAQALAAAEAALVCVLEVPSVPVIAGIVYDVAIQADGKILLAGAFNNVAGSTRYYVARLLSSGALDSGFNPASSQPCVAVLERADGKIFVGGAFDGIAGNSHERIALLNSDGTDALPAGYTWGNNVGQVYSMLPMDDGTTLIGLLSFAGTQGELTRSLADGTLDGSFDTDVNAQVYSIVAQADGKVLLGGSFTSLLSTARNRIARLNAVLTLDATFNPNIGGGGSYVRPIAVDSSGKIYIGGSFATVGGTARGNLARLNSDGTLDTGFSQDLDGACVDILIQANGKILLGGLFTTVGGVARSRIARLNSDGTLDTSFNPGADSTVNSFAVFGSGLIAVGGEFLNIASTASAYLAFLNDDGTIALP